MMQISIKRERLDLLQGQSVTLIRTNEIYDIDALSAERTTAIDIPATARNNRILKLSNDLHSDLNAMREIYAFAELVVDSVTYSGMLYVQSYEYKSKVYKAVFVFGDLTELQRSAIGGKLSEGAIAVGSDYVTPEDAVIDAGAIAEWRIWARVRYGYEPNNASISIPRLIDLFNDQNNVKIILPEEADGMRIIKAEERGFEISFDYSSSLNPNAGSQPDTSVPSEPYNRLQFDTAFFSQVTTQFGLASTIGGQFVQRYWTIAGLRAETALVLYFPDDIPYSFYMQKDGYSGGASGFYGGHWWEDGGANTRPIEHGTGLAGKAVSLNAGDVFYLVNLDDYVNTSSGGLVVQGWQFGEGHSFGYYSFRIKGESRSYLRDNLPDCTVLDLCKSVASVTGTLLVYDRVNSEVRFVTYAAFEPYNFGKLQVIERSELSAGFKDWARDNYIRFTDDEEKKQAWSYSVNAAMLQAEQDLFVVPFSRGYEIAVNDERGLRIDDRTDTLARTIQESTCLVVCDLQGTPFVAKMCEGSTKIRVSCEMNSVQYKAIKSTHVFSLFGAWWSWTAIQWTDGVATMELQQTRSLSVSLLG